MADPAEMRELTPEEEQAYFESGGNLPDDVAPPEEVESAPVESPPEAVQAEPEPEPEPEPAPMTVPKDEYDRVRQGLDRVRNESAAAKNEAQELRERLARLEGQQSALSALYPQDEEEPDPQAKLQEQIAAQDKRARELEQRLAQMDLANRVTAQENAFAAAHDDYAAARDWYVAKRLAYYQSIGYDEQQAQTAWQAEITSKVNDHISNSRDPIAAIYAEAKAFGFSAEAETEKAAKAKAAQEKLAQVQAAQSTSLSEVAPGQGRSTLTPEALADLSEDELMKMPQEEWDRIMRG